MRPTPTKSLLQRAGVATFLVLLHVPPAIALVRGPRLRDWLAFALMAHVIAFGFTGALHRYFAHRSFKTSRAFQFVLGLIASLGFGDPLGFAGKHRLHHRFADTEKDVHSPRQGFYFCWFGSLLDDGYSEAEILQRVPDLNQLPELRWLHRFFWVIGTTAGALFYLAGDFSLFAFGYCLPTLYCIHAASAVNWFGHRRTLRAYETADDSSNGMLLAIAVLGDGWHNNHHRYPQSCRAGFEWWQWDPTYYVLRVLSWLGLIWGLHEVPEHIRRESRMAAHEPV